MRKLITSARCHICSRPEKEWRDAGLIAMGISAICFFKSNENGYLFIFGFIIGLLFVMVAVMKKAKKAKKAKKGSEYNGTR